MRIARIDIARGSGHAPDIRYARLEGDRAHVLSNAPWLGGSDAGEVFAWNDDALLAPLVPSKIVAIGRNYRAHAKELGNEVPSEPLLFLKPPSALLAPGAAIVRPLASSRVEHEAELAVVVGRRAHRVPRTDALSHVFGYTICNDVTARDLQKKDVQFTRAKGFDTFCPIGPWIETELDPSQLGVRCTVRGEVRQDGNTRDMIFDVADLVAYVSHVMTLEPGDVISTGTPAGVGPLLAGDIVEIAIDGIGTLRSPVVDEVR